MAWRAYQRAPATPGWREHRLERDPGHFALWQLQIALGRRRPVRYLPVKPAPA